MGQNASDPNKDPTYSNTNTKDSSNDNLDVFGDEENINEDAASSGDNDSNADVVYDIVSQRISNDDDDDDDDDDVTDDDDTLDRSPYGANEPALDQTGSKFSAQITLLSPGEEDSGGGVRRKRVRALDESLISPGEVTWVVIGIGGILYIVLNFCAMVTGFVVVINGGGISRKKNNKVNITKDEVDDRKCEEVGEKYRVHSNDNFFLRRKQEIYGIYGLDNWDGNSVELAPVSFIEELENDVDVEEDSIMSESRSWDARIRPIKSCYHCDTGQSSGKTNPSSAGTRRYRTTEVGDLRQPKNHQHQQLATVQVHHSSGQMSHGHVIINFRGESKTSANANASSEDVDLHRLEDGLTDSQISIYQSRHHLGETPLCVSPLPKVVKNFDEKSSVIQF